MSVRDDATAPLSAHGEELRQAAGGVDDLGVLALLGGRAHGAGDGRATGRLPPRTIRRVVAEERSGAYEARGR
jgi:hypothetical protein